MVRVRVRVRVSVRALLELPQREAGRLRREGGAPG